MTAKQQPNATKHFEGSSLVPDIKKARASLGVAVEYLYWVGVTADCPVATIDLAGINFPLMNELIRDDPLGGSRKVRVPVIGAIVRLTEDRIMRMAQRLPRTVIRFYTPEVDPKEGDDRKAHPRKGQVITIPTKQEIEHAQKSGKSTREYVPGPYDEPAANYMFARLCENQVIGTRRDEYPAVLSETGLVWPGAISDEIEKLLA